MAEPGTWCSVPHNYYCLFYFVVLTSYPSCPFIPEGGTLVLPAFLCLVSMDYSSITKRQGFKSWWRGRKENEKGTLVLCSFCFLACLCSLYLDCLLVICLVSFRCYRLPECTSLGFLALPHADAVLISNWKGLAMSAFLLRGGGCPISFIDVYTTL